MTTTTKNEETYLNSLEYVLNAGKRSDDRTGTGVKRRFMLMNRYDLQDGFPLLTTKSLDLRSISSELIWFLEGSGDERRLAELRYGKPRNELTNKKTIWTANAQAPYWRDKAEYEGDLGRVYGVQWRWWQTVDTPDITPKPNGRTTTSTIMGVNNVNPSAVRYTDQIANLIKGLKESPYDRRHLITAWNPGEMDQMALPPCHVLSQFFVENGVLSSSLYQRSCDKFLGEPYNIASYALFTMMVAQVCGYEVGEFVHVQGDAHIYDNHDDAVREQLAREPRPAPILRIDTSIRNIDDFTVDSFTLDGYNPHPPIKAPMAV